MTNSTKNVPQTDQIRRIKEAKVKLLALKFFIEDQEPANMAALLDVVAYERQTLDDAEKALQAAETRQIPVLNVVCR